jgi:pyrrolidone-carboxylate peptidase
MYCPPKATLPAALSLAATFLCVTVMLSATRLLAEVSPKIAVQGGVPMATYHAEGAQIY